MAIFESDFHEVHDTHGRPIARPSGVEVGPGKGEADIPKPLKEARLRMIMKEREAIVLRLVDLDYEIWTLEEFFRGRDGP